VAISPASGWRGYSAKCGGGVFVGYYILYLGQLSARLAFIGGNVGWPEIFGIGGWRRRPGQHRHRLFIGQYHLGGGSAAVVRRLAPYSAGVKTAVFVPVAEIG